MITLKHETLDALLVDAEEQRRQTSLAERQALADRNMSPRRDE